jgi:hypothetical protein
MLSLTMINIMFHLRIPAENMKSIFWGITLSLIPLFLSKSLRDQFTIHLYKRNILVGLGLGILTGILHLVTSYGYIISPVFFGKDVLQPGSFQFVPNETISVEGIL